MAASQNRTITLTLNAQTSGADAIKDLANQVEKLGKTGGDARPEFEQLSQELNSLSAQRGAIEAFNDLNTSLNAAQTALKTSQTALSQEKAALDGLTTALNTAKAAEQQQTVVVAQATQDRQQANLELLKARSAYSEYVASIGGAKRATDEQKVVLRDLSQAIRTAKADYEKSRVSVMELTPEMDRLSEATKKAEAAVKEQGRAVSAVQKDVNTAKSSYDQLKTEMEGVSQTAQKVGVDLKNVAAEQNRVTQAIGNSLNTLNTLQQRLEQTGNSAKTASQKIAEAFAGTGVQSINAAQAEILQIDQALLKLARDSTVLESDFNTAFTAAKSRVAALEAEMQKTGKTTEGFGSSFKSALSQFGPASLVFNGVTAAISALTNAASEIPKVTAEFQTLSRTLTIVTGSSSQAAKEFEYLKGVANRTGADIVDLTKSYAKLAAATKETTISSAETKRIFEAVSGAMGNLGASSAETENALMAVTQMISKGTVSMEEMRQQLGERLPGAFQATAKELGVTTEELTQLISSGKLAAADMLPALAAGLEKMYATGTQNDTLIGKWRQFTNALKETGNAIGDSGLVDSLLKVGRIGTSVVTVMVDGFLQVGKSAGILAAGLKEGDLKGALGEIAEGFKGVDERAGKIAGRASETKKSIGDLAKEAKAAGQEFVILSDGTKVATAALDGASSGMVAFQVESTKAETRAETLSTIQRKLAEATRSAGESATTAANALGDETDKRRIAIQVADDNARALGNLLAAERAVLAVLDERALKMVQQVAAKGQASDADLKMIADLNTELEKRKAAVDGITQQVNALEVLKSSLEIQAQLIKDHSNDLVALRASNEDYTKLLAEMRAGVEAGTVAQAELNKVEQEALKIKALYRDALDDQGKKIEAANRAKQGQIDIDTATIRLAIEQQRTIYEVAKARGDEYNAAQAMLKIKQLEIQLSELQAKAKRAEAEAAMAKIQLDREELQAKGQLTQAAALELQAREAAAGVKLKEAEIATELAKRMRELVDASTASGNAAGNSAGGYDAMANSMNKAADAARNLRNAQAGGGGGGGGGGNSGGGVSQASSLPSGSVVDDPTYDHSTFFDGGARSAPSTFDLKDVIYAQGASIAVAEAAAKYVGELFQRKMMAGASGVRTTEQNNDLIKRSTKEAAEEAIRLAKLELAGAQVDLGPSVSEIERRNRAMLVNRDFTSTNEIAFQAIRNVSESAGREALATPVNITIGGQKRSLNVASQADANQLVNVLKMLEQQSSTAAY